MTGLTVGKCSCSVKPVEMRTGLLCRRHRHHSLLRTTYRALLFSLKAPMTVRT